MSEDNRVISLHGGVVQDGRKADERCVEVAEWALAAARSGEITTLAVAYEYHDECVGSRVGGLRVGRSLLGELALLQYRVAGQLDE